jgi:hypothetical protein
LKSLHGLPSFLNIYKPKIQVGIPVIILTFTQHGISTSSDFTIQEQWKCSTN